MRLIARAVLLLAAAGCNGSSVLTAPLDSTFVSIDGPLTFTVTDFPAMVGVLWIAPTAEGARGAIRARGIRYGSLCATTVKGSADVTGRSVVLHVAYMPRPAATCTREVRALEYDAVIDGLSAGRYEVHLMHSEDGGTTETEVRVQQVDVT